MDDLGRSGSSIFLLYRHIREHMTDYYKEDDIDEQLNLDSEEAAQFHYFKLHDYDNNNKLDGLELYAAIAHFSTEHSANKEESGDPTPTPIDLDESQLERLVNTILEQDDENDDGFVDYYEFVQAQRGTKEKQADPNNL